MAINFKYNPGDCISGESITGRAGSFFEKGSIKKNGVTLQKVEFFKSAVCFQDIPITSKRPDNNINVQIEGLKGWKIYGQSEYHSKVIQVNATSGHTQRQTTLKELAYCIINIPIHSRR